MTDIIDRLLTGNFDEEYCIKLFTSVTGFTIEEIQNNAQQTLNVLHETIIKIQQEEIEWPNDKYILKCIILSMFLTKDDEICTNQLLNICEYMSYYNNLKHIRIIECDITDNMLQTICSYFSNHNKTKCNLELIDVSYNLITDQGIKILSQTLIKFHCQTMKNIMVAANYLTDLGVVEISKSVELCPNIEFIDISQQQSNNDDYNRYYSPITNCLPLLSALINKSSLKGIELFDCGIIPHKLFDNNSIKITNIFSNLLCTTPNLNTLQLGRSNLDHPKILKSLLNAFIMRGKWILKYQCQQQLLPIFEQNNMTKDITLDIIQIIKLYIFDFYDDKFHLVLSQNTFNGDIIVPILVEAISSKCFCLGRIDLTGNILTYEQITKIGIALKKNPTIHSISFDCKGYQNGEKLTWNWSDQMREIMQEIYFVKGSSKDIHRGGFVRADHSKIFWSTVANRNTHVCDKSRGTVYS